MAKKKETKKVELKEVSRVEINGNIIITYEDGSVKIIPAPIMLTADQASEIFGSGTFFVLASHHRIVVLHSNNGTNCMSAT